MDVGLSINKLIQLVMSLSILSVFYKKILK